MTMLSRLFNKSIRLFYESLFRLRLSIAERLAGRDDPRLVSFLRSQRDEYFALFQYQEALSLGRRCLKINEMAYGSNHPETVYDLHWLAVLLANNLNQLVEAEQFFRRILEINKILFRLKSPEVALSYFNLAKITSWLSKTKESKEYFRRSLKIRENVLGAEHPDVAKSLFALAFISGDSEAIPLFHRSLKIREKFYGENHEEVADTLHELAMRNFCLGNYVEAESLFKRCIKINVIIDGGKSPATIYFLSGLASMYSHIKRYNSAVLLCKRAINILQEARLLACKMGEISPNDVLSNFNEANKHLYETISYIFIECGHYGEAELVMGMLKDKENFELLRRDGQSNRPIRTISYNDAEAPLIAKINEIGATLHHLGSREEALKCIKRRTAEEELELTHIREKLKLASKAFSDFLDCLHEALPPREVSRIEQDSYRLIDLSDATEGSAAITTVTAGDSFHTILATPYGCKTFSGEYKEEDIARMVLKFRDLLKDPDDKGYLILAQELYDIIIRPMEQEFQDGNISTIYWMLNGSLRLLPIASLHDGNQFVLEKYKNICITTISKIGNSEHQKWNGLGMGVTSEYEGHSPLPSVKDELEGIINVEKVSGFFNHFGFNRYFGKPSSNGVIPGKILLDKAFTRNAMESHLANGYKAVHIASHFELNPVSETLSYLLLGDGSKIRMDELRLTPRLFKGVDLVAFSACSTGLGTASTRGREVDGIGYLGEMQGAKTVMATLWPVEDKSTSMVMREFYRLREAGETKAEALRQAQLALLKKKDGFVSEKPELDFSHPFFWAPFILIGNGG